MFKYKIDSTEAELVSKIEPQIITHRTLTDVIGTVTSCGDVASKIDIKEGISES